MENSVVKLLSKILKIEINSDICSNNTPEWDSLAHMKIIVALEEQYDIEIEDEELSKLDSLDSIVNYLRKKLD